MGLNLEWTQPRMGLNLEWDFLTPEWWDGTQHRMDLKIIMCWVADKLFLQILHHHQGPMYSFGIGFSLWLHTYCSKLNTAMWSMTILNIWMMGLNIEKGLVTMYYVHTLTHCSPPSYSRGWEENVEVESQHSHVQFSVRGVESQVSNVFNMELNSYVEALITFFD